MATERTPARSNSQEGQVQLTAEVICDNCGKQHQFPVECPAATVDDLADAFPRLTLGELANLQKRLGRQGINLEIGVGEEVVEEVYIPNNPTNLQTRS